MIGQECETFEAMWSMQGLDMASEPGNNGHFGQTIANRRGGAVLILSSSRRGDTCGVRAILRNERRETEVDWRFDESSSLAWTYRDLATAFDCLPDKKDAASDEEFAQEVGAEFAVREKFARIGPKLVIFCKESSGEPPKRRFFSIYVGEQMRKNVSMLLP